MVDNCVTAVKAIHIHTLTHGKHGSVVCECLFIGGRRVPCAFSREGPSARPHRLPSQLAQDLNQHWAAARTRCTTPLLVPQLIPWLAADAAAFLTSH